MLWPNTKIDCGPAIWMSAISGLATNTVAAGCESWISEPCPTASVSAPRSCAKAGAQSSAAAVAARAYAGITAFIG